VTMYVVPLTNCSWASGTVPIRRLLYRAGGPRRARPSRRMLCFQPKCRYRLSGAYDGSLYTLSQNILGETISVLFTVYDSRSSLSPVTKRSVLPFTAQDKMSTSSVSGDSIPGKNKDPIPKMPELNGLFPRRKFL
jgi:hypothetical protein